MHSHVARAAHPRKIATKQARSRHQM